MSLALSRENWTLDRLVVKTLRRKKPRQCTGKIIVKSSRRNRSVGTSLSFLWCGRISQVLDVNFSGNGPSPLHKLAHGQAPTTPIAF